MPTTTVTVQYVNPPKEGKKKGSIKTSDGQYYGVWPDKLSQFEKGGSYTIEYKENGQYKDFVAMVGGAAPAPAASHGAPAHTSKPNGNDSRMIFITGIVGRAMGSGNFEPAAIHSLTACAAEAYDALAAGTLHTKAVAQFEDAVPF